LEGVKNGQGVHENIEIIPSTDDGHYLVTLIVFDRPGGGATFEGMARPIHGDRVWVFVEAAGIKPELFKWERIPCARMDSEIWEIVKHIFEVWRPAHADGMCRACCPKCKFLTDRPDLRIFQLAN